MPIDKQKCQRLILSLDGDDVIECGSAALWILRPNTIEASDEYEFHTEEHIWMCRDHAKDFYVARGAVSTEFVHLWKTWDRVEATVCGRVISSRSSVPGWDMDHEAEWLVMLGPDYDRTQAFACSLHLPMTLRHFGPAVVWRLAKVS